MNAFDARKFLIWYSNRDKAPTPEEVARWQHAECLGEAKDLAKLIHQERHERTLVERNLKNARSNLDEALHKIEVLERTCDRAVAKVHFMEHDLKKRGPLPADEDKLYRSLCIYAEELVRLHDTFDEGNAKRFGPAVNRMRHHLEKCSKK